MKSAKNSNKAFSLVELLVVIAILAILTYVFMGPGMRWYHQYKLYSEGQRLHYLVMEAKTYAISNSVYTSLCAKSSSLTIYNVGSNLTSYCNGKVVESYTLPSYESSYLTYTGNPGYISFDSRGVSAQNGNVCVYDSYINQYYMICVSYVGIRDTSGTGVCPTNCSTS
ncbi:MAG: prepilin-type N-terminal cleavage/methylation domain-containing protein [Hydrogenobaculum sp.]